MMEVNIKALAKRKGQTQPALVWTGVVVGVFVLVMVLYFLFFKTGAPLTQFFKNLPSWGQDVARVKDVEIARYDIISGDVAFYDGENWVLLKTKVQMNNKELNRDMFAKQLHDFFYDTSKRNMLGSSKLSFIDADLTFNPGPFSKNIVLKRPIITIEKGSNNYYLIGYGNNQLYSLTGSFSNGVITKSDGLVSGYISWRDSIFKGASNATAVSVSYNLIDGQTSTPQTRRYCVEKHDKYLVVRLNQEVSSDAECR
jgi:hypothetical protein